MALIHGIAMLTLMLLFLLAVTGVGTWVLQTLRLSIDTKMQHALVSAALGVLAVEVVFSGIEYTQQIRKGALVIAAPLLVFVVRGFKVMRTVLARGWQELANSRSKMLIVTAIAVVLTFEFLACQAPLTGSDALHYHFTTEKLVLQNGFGPQFSIVLSFFLRPASPVNPLRFSAGRRTISNGVHIFRGRVGCLLAGCVGGAVVSFEDSVVVYAVVSADAGSVLADLLCRSTGCLDGLLCYRSSDRIVPKKGDRAFANGFCRGTVEWRHSGGQIHWICAGPGDRGGGGAGISIRG